METYTPHQIRYFAEQIMLHRPQASIDGLASAMSGVKVDLNPHQVDAALFALKSPLSNGSLLADEVGLGKTIEARNFHGGGCKCEDGHLVLREGPSDGAHLVL